MTTSSRKRIYDNSEFQHDGRTFRVRYEQDTDAGYPWDNEDGHGIIRKAREPHYDGRSDKRPSEVPMNQPDRNEYQFYYDWAATMTKARAEGWGLNDGAWWQLAAKLGRDPTKREIVAESVRRDFVFCAFVLNDHCPYVGVIVELLGANGTEGEPVAETSVWAIPTFDDYHMIVAYELAEGILYDRRSQWRDALTAARARKASEVKEAGERLYWATRDVMTEGVTC